LAAALTVYFAQWLVQWLVQWLAREQARANARGSDKLTRVRSTEVLPVLYGGNQQNTLGPWSRGGKRCCTAQALSVFSCITFYCTFVHHRICLEHLLLWFEFIRAQATTRALLHTFHMTITLSRSQPIPLLRLKGRRSLFFD
jgi:hypothetical protein